MIEGFLLFADPGLCELLHSGLWLSVDDGELLARRRFLREGGFVEDDHSWASFREEFVGHIYEHHLRAAPAMLANARAIIFGTITVNEAKTVEAMVDEAQQLIDQALLKRDGGGGGGQQRRREGAERGAPGSKVGSKVTALDSPAPSRLPPRTSPPAELSTPQPTLDPPCTPPPCTPPPPAGTSTLQPTLDPPCTPPPCTPPPPAGTSTLQPTVTQEVGIAALPPHSRVAVLDFLGSFCPVTTAHVAAITTARRILLGEIAPLNADGALTSYNLVLGAMTVNSDSHVHFKLSRAGEEGEALSARQRLHLCSLATADEVSWLRIGTSAAEWVASLQASFPAVEFTVWMLNGADDVVRYEKWEWASASQPFITMGRHGDTEAIIDAIKREGLLSNAFVLGPDLPDISSTAARHALRQTDTAMVQVCLHPHVASFLEQYGPYGGRP